MMSWRMQKKNWNFALYPNKKNPPPPFLISKLFFILQTHNHLINKCQVMEITAESRHPTGETDLQACKLPSPDG